MTPGQLAILERTTDPVKREVLRRLFEKAGDAANLAVETKPIALVLDPDAERARRKWRT
ncbi:hypothetical protein [Sphingomonas sp.]|uniref:hypothetical protein n=1 Tax=Sphingomonas sp. TaxID=28214 RepID=UPI0025E8B263|nr:hypothetical protein [Sphingomonas sp.]